MSGVVPSSNPTGYLGLSERNPPDIITTNRNPLSTDRRNYKIGDLWYNKNLHTFWILVSLTGNLANWQLLANASSGSVDMLTANSGGPISPDVAGNINILGSGQITIAGNNSLNTLTASLTGTTNHALQAGDSVGGIASIALGTNNTVLLGQTGSNPAWGVVPNAALQNSTITVTAGPGITVVGSPVALGGSLTVSSTALSTLTFTEDLGSASVAADNINILGTSTQGIVTTGGASTITINALNATSTQKGVVSFNATEFTVTAGAVASNPLTVSAGTGLSGGGSLNLGGTTTLSLAIPVTVPHGGTGTTTTPTNGQLLIGNTGTGAYNLATLTSTGASVAITNGAGTINLEVASTTLNSLTGNSGGAVPPTAGNINIVGTSTITVVGVPGTSTLTVTPAASGYPISPFIVGPAGQAGYQTIQSAVNAANTNAMATGSAQSVYIQPGTYTENLTLYDKVSLIGATGAVDSHYITIIGTHTPPASGQIDIYGIFWQGATAIFSSAAAGSTQFNFFNTIMQLTGSGYSFDLANWTGLINGFIYLQLDGVGTNGFLNNATGSSDVILINSAINLQQSNATALINGNVEWDNVYIGIKCQYGGATKTMNFNGGNCFLNTHTFTGSTTGVIVDSTFQTGANAAIVQSSTGSFKLADVHIDSSAVNVIQGAGAGTLNLGSVTFTNSSGIAGTLTISGPGSFYTSSNLKSSRPDNVNVVSLTAQNTGTNTTLISSLAANGNAGFFSSGQTDTTKYWNFGQIPTASTPANGFNISYNNAGQSDPSIGTIAISCTTAGAVKISNVYTLPTADGTSGQVVKTNGAGTLSFTDAGVTTWSDTSGVFTAARNTGYFLTGASTATLPAAPSQGDTVDIVCDTTGSCVITANTGQFIRISNQLSSSAGTATNSARGDSLQLVYRASGTTWFTSASPNGAWTTA